MSDIPALAQVLVQDCAGSRAIIQDAEPLNQARARVYRLTLKGAPYRSVIAKIWEGPEPLDHSNEWSAQFCCEMRAYQFFAQISPALNMVPKLLGKRSDALLITDLGVSLKDVKKDPGPYFDHLARAFAKLHMQAAARLDQFEPPLPQHVGLRFDREIIKEFFQAGAEFLRSRYELRCVRNQSDALEAAILRAQTTIETPGPFTTLIHADIGAARQLTMQENEIAFMDFEHARIDHALLDLAVPVLGKIEQNLATMQLVWTGQSFDLSLCTAYRRARQDLGGYVGPDTEWQRNCSAALVYHALVFIGELCKLRHDYQLAARMTQVTAGLLFGLSQHLKELRQFPEIYYFCREFLAEHDPHRILGW